MENNMEEFGLNLDNILSDEQIAALNANQEEPTVITQNPDKPQNVIDTEDLTIDNLFGSESVGDSQEVETTKKEEDVTNEEDLGESPSQNLYSSIAEAFRVDDIFPDLSEDDIKNVKSADDFRELVKKQFQNNLTERQRRLETLLNGGVEPSQIKTLESNIQALQNIKEEALDGETEEAVNLRKLLILQDYRNRGYSEDRAKALTERSFENHTDVEDAKLARQSNLEFYQNEYSDLCEEAEATVKQEEENRQKMHDELKKSILEDTKAFGEVDVDKKTRQKVYEVITKPVFKQGDNYYTELQQYDIEHHSDFMKAVGYLYVVTDGFKSLNKLEQKVEKKAKKKGIEDLERVLRGSTVREANGEMKFVSGVNENPTEQFRMAIDTSGF